jgi:hypothetical protein
MTFLADFQDQKKVVDVNLFLRSFRPPPSKPYFLNDDLYIFLDPGV